MRSDSFPFKRLYLAILCCRPARQKLVRPPGNSRQQDKSPSVVRYRYYKILAYGEDTTIDTRKSHRACRYLYPAYGWSKSSQLHSVAHKIRHRPYTFILSPVSSVHTSTTESANTNDSDTGLLSKSSYILPGNRWIRSLPAASLRSIVKNFVMGEEVGRFNSWHI
jgi:hypothetical protein